MTNEQTLSQIARKIKTFEKTTVAAAVEIGGLLHEAKEKFPGEYKAWLLREFGWSYRTSLRFYHAWDFAKKCQFGTFKKLNLSLSALHLVADPNTDEAARKAIVKAALKGRVSYSAAEAIIAKHEEAAQADPIEPGDIIKLEPKSEPPIEPLDDDDELPDDDPTSRDDEPTPLLPDDGTGNALHVLVTCTDLTEAARTLTRVELRRIIDALESAYKKMAGGDSVKMTADRAEAKSLRH